MFDVSSNLEMTDFFPDPLYGNVCHATWSGSRGSKTTIYFEFSPTCLPPQ